MNVNKAIIIGRLGADPEVRFTQSNTCVATLSIATTEKWKDQSGALQEKTEWHRVVFWGKSAETIQQYAKKGEGLYVEGQLETVSWEDKDGIKRYSTQIKGRNFQFLTPKPASNEQSPQKNTNTQQRAPEPVNQAPTPFDEDSFDDDDLPF